MKIQKIIYIFLCTWLILDHYKDLLIRYIHKNIMEELRQTSTNEKYKILLYNFHHIKRKDVLLDYFNIEEEYKNLEVGPVCIKQYYDLVFNLVILVPVILPSIRFIC